MHLASYIELAAQGWEHIDDFTSQEEADDRIAHMRLLNDSFEYCLGEPCPSMDETWKVFSEAVVGLYRRGGRPQGSVLEDITPSLPSFSDPFIPMTKPEYNTKTPHDKPLEPIMCGAA